MTDILKTAHIHVEQIIFRVHVGNAYHFNIEGAMELKPDYVLDVSRSNDKSQQMTTLLVTVIGDEYDLDEMADWIKQHDLDF